MPATRSSSVQPRSQPTGSPPHQRAKSKKQPSRTESIAEILSFSSSGESSSAGPSRPKRTVSLTTAKKPPSSNRTSEKPRSKVKRPIIPQEVIEISSDDECYPSNVVVSPRRQPLVAAPIVEVPPPEPAAIADFRRQISKYREEAAKSKRDLEKVSKEVSTLREENKQLQALRKPGTGKITLDTEKITDHLDCEICTTRMWTPYVLPDCGHTFCQSCLTDWFAQTQAQYIAAHPQYNPNAHLTNDAARALHAITQTIVMNPHAANHPHIRALLDQSLPGHPEYTCPTCREKVTSKPIESFAIKAIARTVGAAMGESSPKKAPAGRGKAPANAAGAWDGFFPVKRI